jgi:cell division transport system permease protein
VSRIARRLARGWRRISGIGEAELVPQARLSGPMPWVIAIMVALTMIAAAAGLALRNAADAAAAELAGGITVQIVEAAPEARAAQAQAAVRRLGAMPDVVSVRRVPQEEVDVLIEPWLGRGVEDGAAGAIPVPALIDVRIASEVTPERLVAIQRALRDDAPAARVDAQSSWLEPVFDALESLQWLALALIVLLATALAAAVLLAARTALGTNRDTIEIVHLLGGTDAQIARVFQRSIAVDAAGGGVVGLALALVVILFLGRRFAGLGAGMVDQGALGVIDWLLLALVPVIAVALAVVTARLTLLHSLRKML